MSLLRIDGLTVDLPAAHGTFRVIEDQSLDVPVGAVVGIVGESGSGKSMLLRAITDILPDGSTRTWERAEFDGQPVADTARLPIAMVFQDPMTSFNPLMRVGAHLVEVARRQRRSSRADAKKRAIEALAAARVPDPERVFGRYPHELSGGLRQRAMIAMALLAEPRLLLADEPTTALDATVQAEILALLAQLRDERRLTIVIVTHDLGVVAAICDTVAVMKDGAIVERGPVDTVFAEPQHPYTRSLLAAAPDRSGQ
ncbi:oligopeptide transport system ATP-binding protein [Microbacterium terrae]|uniref:Oligopeptide transport ATP-binding protein OppD n=1 Tax=Microbacterium terrae TaxID=69369 RepID=A0A0M2GZ25_9MICO|nr:ABC transporter ATP-binding protein [Microbacterium terrae]KJL39352.1 Oligopeptide transport ATP-binding protein OppD [Microbacterium terrae]MBP1078360.1 oligopeptide transport system ATP-binding protein [Microbacterium terrae]GLJ97840.1 ABC transporter ATP-binding protein [Microbacterium terrae]